MSNEEKIKYTYCFPQGVARIMKKVDERTQFEAAMLSTFFIIIGLVLFTVYSILYLPYTWWFKGLVIFNSFWGVLFLSAQLVMTFQQYQTYMTVFDMIKKEKEEKEATKTTTNIKVKGGLV